MQLSEKLKLFFKDHYHLVFKGSANNYQRLQQCLPDENGNVTCSVSFSSYSELKKYQKKLRTVTVSLASAIAMVIVALIVSPYIFNPSGSQAGSYTWKQMAWNDGANTDAAIKDGETNYASKDPSIIASTDLTLDKPADWSETADGDFSTNTSKDTTLAIAGNSVKLLKPIGAACTVATAADCTGGYCNASNVCEMPFVCGTSTVSYLGYTYGTVQVGTQCWLDRNLGATAVATAYNTQAAYGWLYQWGRLSDNHQYTAWGSQSSPALSGTTSTLSAADVPGHANFITSTASPYDWRGPSQSNYLWGSADGYINNPCPTGWHVPTGGIGGEWDTVRTALSITNSSTAASSALHLPAAGDRSYTGGLAWQGTYGYYWSSNPNGTSAYTFFFGPANAAYSTFRAFGCSVRCIKN